MYRMGPFQYVYTEREQKIRDLVQHMVAKHGLNRARREINREYLYAAAQFEVGPQVDYWLEAVRAMKALISALEYGARVGL